MKSDIKNGIVGITDRLGVMALMLILVFICLAVSIPMASRLAGIAIVAIGFGVSTKIRKKKQVALKNASSDYVFIGGVNWHDRFNEAVAESVVAVDDLQTTSNQTADDKEFAGQSIHKSYPVFKSKSNIASYYWRIEDICNTIQCGHVGKIEKQRAAHLKQLAETIIEYLQDLDNLGQLDLYTVMMVDGKEQRSDCCHADKGEIKLKLIFRRLEDMLIKQANRVSDQISEIKVDEHG